MITAQRFSSCDTGGAAVITGAGVAATAGMDGAVDIAGLEATDIVRSTAHITVTDTAIRLTDTVTRPMVATASATAIPHTATAILGMAMVAESAWGFGNAGRGRQAKSNEIRDLPIAGGACGTAGFPAPL